MRCHFLKLDLCVKKHENFSARFAMKHTEIKKLLPSVMQRSMANNVLHDAIGGNKGSSVLNTFIEVMEKMHRPTENLLDNLHDVFNPRQVPERFLPMLAHWTNLINLFQPDKAGSEPSFWKERTLPTEPGYLRELIAMSVEISQWRGTNYGLKKVLQMATGISNFSIKETDKPFHIEVGVPEEAQKYWELIQRIVAQEKPAHITAGSLLPTVRISIPTMKIRKTKASTTKMKTPTMRTKIRTRTNIMKMKIKKSTMKTKTSTPSSSELQNHLLNLDHLLARNPASPLLK